MQCQECLTTIIPIEGYPDYGRCDYCEDAHWLNSTSTLHNREGKSSFACPLCDIHKEVVLTIQNGTTYIESTCLCGITYHERVTRIVDFMDLRPASTKQMTKGELKLAIDQWIDTTINTLQLVKHFVKYW